MGEVCNKMGFEVELKGITRSNGLVVSLLSLGVSG